MIRSFLLLIIATICCLGCHSQTDNELTADELAVLDHAIEFQWEENMQLYLKLSGTVDDTG